MPSSSSSTRSSRRKQRQAVAWRAEAEAKHKQGIYIAVELWQVSEFLRAGPVSCSKDPLSCYRPTAVTDCKAGEVQL